MKKVTMNLMAALTGMSVVLIAGPIFADAPAELQRAAMEALVSISQAGDSSVPVKLCEVLENNPYAPVRERAAQLLGDIPSPGLIVPSLRRALEKEQDTQARTAIVDALQKQGATALSSSATSSIFNNVEKQIQNARTALAAVLDMDLPPAQLKVIYSGMKTEGGKEFFTWAVRYTDGRVVEKSDVSYVVRLGKGGWNLQRESKIEIPDAKTQLIEVRAKNEKTGDSSNTLSYTIDGKTKMASRASGLTIALMPVGEQKEVLGLAWPGQSAVPISPLKKDAQLVSRSEGQMVTKGTYKAQGEWITGKTETTVDVVMGGDVASIRQKSVETKKDGLGRERKLSEYDFQFDPRTGTIKMDAKDNVEIGDKTLTVQLGPTDENGQFNYNKMVDQLDEQYSQYPETRPRAGKLNLTYEGRIIGDVKDPSGERVPTRLVIIPVESVESKDTETGEIMFKEQAYGVNVPGFVVFELAPDGQILGMYFLRPKSGSPSVLISEFEVSTELYRADMFWDLRGGGRCGWSMEE